MADVSCADDESVETKPSPDLLEPFPLKQE